MSTVLYLGAKGAADTSRHRAEALIRKGHRLIHWDPFETLPPFCRGRLGLKLNNESGFLLVEPWVRRWLAKNLSELKEQIDAVWIDGGELFSPDCLKLLRNLGCPVVLYSIDDPTGGRDGRKFLQLIRSLPLYDLCVGMRKCSVEEMKALGARRVMRVFMSCDELAHRPPDPDELIPDDLVSEVMFAGTWMRHEGRDRFFRTLLDAGIPLSIWGGRWDLSPDRDLVNRCWKGRPLKGREYSLAIAGSKVAIGLLSKGNRDEHTTRSQEIPYAGGLLCAERTGEHLALYHDGEEAVFWNDEQECVACCKELLENSEKRQSIRIAGMKRVRENKVANEDIVHQIFQQVLG